MIKAILFDFDGTLVNSAPGIVKTMEQTYLEMGIAVPDEDAMRASIGLPLKQALQQLAGLTDALAEIATETYRRLFPIYEANYITVFPQVRETLEALQEKGIRMAIVTSRDTNSLELVMGKRELNSYFETRVTGADGYTPKPAPDMVEALLTRMNLKQDEVLVVGDTTFDIEMGNRAGCKTIAVTYGNHTQEQLAEAQPTYTIDNFNSLLEVL